ncbi:hypothetical protein Nepgr_002636 [Nepenthes gracilis]|uniref:Uncharacterized protein n=1 Tax=Nepenthes gracilis TaxID=150966 RepID=A0AAD3RX24_NEPGR|nr:hypothetical protein Nepgr_002636 [Nepenthes gracilis]
MLIPGPAVALSCASFCLTDDQMLMGSALRASAGLLDAADCHGSCVIEVGFVASITIGCSFCIGIWPDGFGLILIVQWLLDLAVLFLDELEFCCTWNGCPAACGGADLPLLPFVTTLWLLMVGWGCCWNGCWILLELSRECKPDAFPLAESWRSYSCVGSCEWLGCSLHVPLQLLDNAVYLPLCFTSMLWFCCQNWFALKRECSGLRWLVPYSSCLIAVGGHLRASNAPVTASLQMPKSALLGSSYSTNICSIKDQQLKISQDASRATQTEAAHHPTIAAVAMTGGRNNGSASIQLRHLRTLCIGEGQHLVGKTFSQFQQQHIASNAIGEATIHLSSTMKEEGTICDPLLHDRPKQPPPSKAPARRWLPGAKELLPIAVSTTFFTKKQTAIVRSTSTLESQLLDKLAPMHPKYLRKASSLPQQKQRPAQQPNGVAMLEQQYSNIHQQAEAKSAFKWRAMRKQQFSATGDQPRNKLKQEPAASLTSSRETAMRQQQQHNNRSSHHSKIPFVKQKGKPPSSFNPKSMPI